MTRTKEKVERSPGELVHELEMALEAQRGVDVAMKVDQVIKADAWRSFKRPYERTERQFGDFATFVADRRGLGLTADQLRFFCTSTPRILGELDTLIKRKGKGAPTPDTTAATRHHGLRRLREERPDLYERVERGELSPYAAMIEGGYRRRTATVAVDDVDSVARFLQRRFSKAQIRKLVELLAS